MRRAELVKLGPLILLIPLIGCAAKAQIKVGGGTIGGGGIGLPAPPPLCGLPNFCSPTNANVDQTSAPGALIGLTGLGATFTDVTGNLIIRATDYTLNGGTSATTAFRTNSDSNDNVWSSDDKAFGICRTGGSLYIDAFDPVTHAVTPKGIATSAKGLCDQVSWLHSTPMSYFYTSGSTLLKETIDTSSGTWTGSPGDNTNLSAAINTVTLLDVSTQCSGFAFNRYMAMSDVNGLDSVDRYVGFGNRLVQDEGFQSFIYDSVNGCHWIDSRAMTEGGAWGASGAITGAAVLIPTPAAPAVTAVTNGSGALINTHQYRVCITETKNNVGETPCSSNSTVTTNTPNNAISVTSPGATPANTVSAPTGFNVYACDNTASPGCSPVLQTNGTNASGALLQPTGVSAACTVNCSGTRAYTFWVYATNAGGQSPLSASFTSAATMGDNSTFTVSVNQVTNAATYSVFTDFTYNLNVLNNAGTCGAGVCTITVNTNPAAVGFKIKQNETVPIATTPVITAVAATAITPPSTNTTGIKFHNVKVDGTGKWAKNAPAGGNTFQAAYTTDPTLFVDVLTGASIFGANTSVPSLSVGTICVGHDVMGQGTIFGRDCNTGKHSVWTLNDNSATAEASEISLDTMAFDAYDEHQSAQMQAGGATFPFYTGSAYANTHAVAAGYLDNYMYATKNVAGANLHWKFCQNWQSGLQGFNSQVSGHPSPDGKFILFSSDMGVGIAVTSGQLGNTSGGATCTDAVDCRTDAYVCVTR